jgi:hypothetical protein
VVNGEQRPRRAVRAASDRLRSRDTRALLWIILTVVVFAVLFLIMEGATSAKTNSSRENGLYQFIFLAVGVGASFVFGRQSARATAADILRPVAKAAVRRLANLAAGLQSLGGALNSQRVYVQERAEENDGTVSLAEVGQAQDMLEIQIAAQLRTVIDAIEDWREFVPDEVAAVEEGGGEGHGN